MEVDNGETSPVNHQDEKAAFGGLNSGQNSAKDEKKEVPACASTSTSDDEDEDEDEPVDALKDKGWMDEVPVSPESELQHEMNGQILPANNPSDFGDVCIKNSSNVHLGSRVFYKGPVTIKQFVYTNSASATDDVATGSNANENDDNGSRLSVNSAESRTSLQPFYFFSNPKVAEWFRTRRCILTVSISASILVLLNILSIWISDPTFEDVRLIPRVEWGAQPPTKAPTPLTVVPAPYVIISHTASAYCYTQAQCVLNVRVAQTFHIESKGWNDIAYNFLVGGDGLVYEGRGWNVEGAHTFDYNDKSIGISFIGTFNSVKPTKAQLHALKKLIELGVKEKRVSKDYKLLGHRQCIKTESPGEALYNIIKTWSHWSPTP